MELLQITTQFAAGAPASGDTFTIFVQLSLAFAVAAVISVIMRLLKQPLVIGYILSGIIVGPSVLNLIKSQEAFQAFSEIGIALLLFIIGLGLNMTIIKSLGKVSVLTATVILLLVGSTGHLAAYLLGFDVTTAVLMGVALFFSSTIIILKVLSDKHETGRLYGQIAIGVILVDDVIATIALVVVTMMSKGNISPQELSLLIGKAALLVGGLFATGVYLVPKIGKFLAASQELLFIFSIGWGLTVATLFGMAGLSHEIGALFAGVAIAGLPYATEMASKLKPLRDFFIVLFFIGLGELFKFDDIQKAIVPALILSLIVMIGKPLFVMASLGFLRYTRLTSFKAAIHLSQISEFSIILIIFAAANNVASKDAVPVITLVALITIALSTYLMQYDDKIFKKIDPILRLFERKKTREARKKASGHAVMLFGYHKGGHEFVRAFREMKQDYIVVDYNPEIIEHLEHQGIRHAYGDVTDDEFLEEISAAHAELIVSTIDVLDINMATLKYLRRHNPKISFICHATSYKDAEELYAHGASYVSIPHFIGSERVSSFIKRKGMSHTALASYRNKHLITIGKKAVHVSH